MKPKFTIHWRFINFTLPGPGQTIWCYGALSQKVLLATQTASGTTFCDTFEQSVKPKFTFHWRCRNFTLAGPGRNHLVLWCFKPKSAFGNPNCIRHTFCGIVEQAMKPKLTFHWRLRNLTLAGPFQNHLVLFCFEPEIAFGNPNCIRHNFL